MAQFNSIERLIKSNENVRLLVIDSLIFYFRHGCPDKMARPFILYDLIQNLMKAASSHNVAVSIKNALNFNYYICIFMEQNSLLIN